MAECFGTGLAMMLAVVSIFTLGIAPIFVYVREKINGDKRWNPFTMFMDFDKKFPVDLFLFFGAIIWSVAGSLLVLGLIGCGLIKLYCFLVGGGC